MNFNQLSQKEDVLYQELIKLTKQSIEDISKLFNRKDVLFHKQNLTSILAALESILDELYLRLTDVPTIIQFVKLYNLNYLLWISDELNDLELQLDEYNFTFFSDETKLLAGKAKSSLLMLCQKTVQLIDVRLAQK